MSVPKLKLLNVMPSRATDFEGLKKDYNDLIQKLVMHFGVASFEAGRFRGNGLEDQWVPTTDAAPTAAATATQIDLSKDGMPGGAVGVWLRWRAENSSGATALLTFATSSGGTYNDINRVPTATNMSTVFPAFFYGGTTSIWLKTDQTLVSSNALIMGWIF